MVSNSNTEKESTYWIRQYDELLAERDRWHERSMALWDLIEDGAPHLVSEATDIWNKVWEVKE